MNCERSEEQRKEFSSEVCPCLQPGGQSGVLGASDQEDVVLDHETQLTGGQQHETVTAASGVDVDE